MSLDKHRFLVLYCRSLMEILEFLLCFFMHTLTPCVGGSYFYTSGTPYISVWCTCYQNLSGLSVYHVVTRNLTSSFLVCHVPFLGYQFASSKHHKCIQCTKEVNKTHRPLQFCLLSFDRVLLKAGLIRNICFLVILKVHNGSQHIRCFWKASQQQEQPQW